MHGTLPTAPTCSCILFLPLHQTVTPNPDSAADYVYEMDTPNPDSAADYVYKTDTPNPDSVVYYVYENFKERMDMAILNTVGFGQLCISCWMGNVVT